MEKVDEKVLFQGQWLSIKQLHYLSNDKKQILWESITRKNTGKILVIIAKLNPSNRYVLIKQFRPSINNTVLGFPAGLAETEDIQKEALKELKEETGFFGKITELSPTLALSPALTNELVQICHASIDETDPRNINPKQELEPEEEIEVVLVASNNVRQFLLDEQAMGFEISAGLWYLFGITP